MKELNNSEILYLSLAIIIFAYGFNIFNIFTIVSSSTLTHPWVGPLVDTWKNIADPFPFIIFSVL